MSDPAPGADPPPADAEAPPRPAPFPSRGRLVGVDYGHVRVGLAACDPDRLVASPLETYARRSLDQDAAYFRKLAAAEGAVGWVVGLPISLNGTEGPKARECRAFGAWLAAGTGLPVAFHDERFTTAAAEDFLIEAGVSFKNRRGKRDRVAAQLILRAFLDAGCPAD